MRTCPKCKKIKFLTEFWKTCSYCKDCQKEHWRNMQIAGMKKDFSWKKSAKKYIWLYKKAIKNHKDKLNEDSK